MKRTVAGVVAGLILGAGAMHLAQTPVNPHAAWEACVQGVFIAEGGSDGQLAECDRNYVGPVAR